MNKTTKKILKVSGIAAGAAAAASLSAYVTTKYLVNTALDREPPRMMKKADKLIAGAQKIDPAFLSRAEESSERLAATESETAKIVSQDGSLLVGHFIPCDNPRRVIIAVHGWRSSWHKDFGMIADFWHNNGCSVLYVEQRGQNNSEGEHMGFGLTERYDCLSWVNWVIGRCGNDLPIYLAGVSMGAATVLMASGLELPENVHGIMADCGFTSPGAIWKHVAEKNLHILYGMHGAIADALCRRKILVGAGEYSTVEALQHATVPVLFVHGTDDHFVPVEMTYENYRACASPKRLLIVPGADHGMSYFVEPARYEEAVKDFWRMCD